MNTSIVNLSLKYIKNNNYNLIIKLSKWIYEELILIKYNDSKLNKALEVEDIEVIKILINLVQNKNLLNKYMYKFINKIHILKLFLENGANVHTSNDEALIWSTRYGYYKVVKLLLKNGANIHANNDEALKYA